MSLTVRLYNCTAEPNRIDKSSFLTAIGTDRTGTVKGSGEIDVVNPVVLLTGTVDVGTNYAEISNFSRYYYVDEITSV